MDRLPLVTRAGWWLMEGATAALWLALLYRALAGIVINPQFWRGNLSVIRPSHLWLLESQLLAAAGLLITLYLLSCYLPQMYEGLFSRSVGLAGWLVALTMLPRSWPQIWSAGRLAPWLVWLALGGALAAWAWRWYLAQRWRNVVSGHGYAWILDWAAGRPLAARLIALRVLRVLGWQG